VAYLCIVERIVAGTGGRGQLQSRLQMLAMSIESLTLIVKFDRHLQ